MHCPYCSVTDCRVVDSRLVAEGAVTWRRRECEGCKRRFTTYERLENSLPTVVKKNGQREAFNREKLLRSLQVACNKRPVSVDVLDEVASQVERRLGEGGHREVSSQAIGLAVMEALKRIKANTIEKRLLDERGEPSFGISFYVLNAKGEHAGVSMFTGSNYAVCTENGPETRPVEGLMGEAPIPF